MHIFTCIIEEVICCRSYIIEGHISHGSYITDARISLRSYITEGIFVPLVTSQKRIFSRSYIRFFFQELNQEGGYIYQELLSKEGYGSHEFHHRSYVSHKLHCYITELYLSQMLFIPLDIFRNGYHICKFEQAVLEIMVAASVADSFLPPSSF